MTGRATSTEDVAALWRCIATCNAGEGAVSDSAVARFAAIVTPALSAYLLGTARVEAVLGADAVSQSRLVNRFTAAAQLAALARIAEAGIDVVAIKGFAFAHTLYPEPELRTVGDLDVLVHPAARDGLIDCLGAQGYAFRPLPRPPWGFISTASYMPFVSADGAVNLDIHIQPDCWPAFRSLTTARVFADALAVDAGGVALRVPSDTHAFLLCATNAAKDKFGVFAARKIVDALLLLQRRAPDIDTAESLAREGGFLLPCRVFLALLHALGADLPRRYAAVNLPRRARGEFARLRDDALALWPEEPGLLATLRRELTVCTEPSVGIRNGISRLFGLVRPGTGIPARGSTA